MSRPSKRQKQSRWAAFKYSIQKVTKTIGANLAVFICILGHLSYESFVIVATLLGHTPPNEKAYTFMMRKAGTYLKSYAEKSADYYLSKMKPGAAVSIDASWVSKTTSKFCIVEAIDIAQKKIVSFFIVDSYKKSIFHNFDNSSNLMESFGLKFIIPKLKSQNKIATLVKDGDLLFNNIVKDYKWDVSVIQDMGHLLKNWNTTFKKYNKLCNSKLSGIDRSIHDFLSDILYEDSETSEKVRKWKNVIKHFMGDHSKCTHGNVTCKHWKHAKDKEAQKALQALIDHWMPFVKTFKKGQNTCLNENFHSVKAQYLQKIDFTGDSFMAKLCASILDYNMDKSWVSWLIDQLHIPKSIKYLAQILSLYISHRKDKAKKQKIKEKKEKHEKNIQKKKQKEIESKIYKNSHSQGKY